MPLSINIRFAKISHNKDRIDTYQLHMFCVFGILVKFVFVERWTGALQVRPRSQTVQIT